MNDSSCGACQITAVFRSDAFLPIALISFAEFSFHHFASGSLWQGVCEIDCLARFEVSKIPLAERIVCLSSALALSPSAPLLPSVPHPTSRLVP